MNSTHSISLGDAVIVLQRTLRIPDDGNKYALPPGMGSFPIYRTADYTRTLPAGWKEKDAYFIPMYQREAMWIRFNGGAAAIQIAVGKVNAVSGTPWDGTAKLIKEPQNYVVAPDPQPWLDGINAGDGMIKQFVAMPLGGGHTVEEQVTGKAEFGGIQFSAFAPLPGKIREELAARGGLEAMAYSAGPIAIASAGPMIGTTMRGTTKGLSPDSGVSAGKDAAEMGLGAGGRMHQKIYPDPYGLDVWDIESRKDAWIYICNIPMFQQITGLPAPECPLSAKDYTNHGYPWFDLYDESYGDVSAPNNLKGVKSVADIEGINETGDGFNIPDEKVVKYEMKKTYGAPPK